MLGDTVATIVLGLTRDPLRTICSLAPASHRLFRLAAH
jgi:hypothetical protein